MRDEDCEKAAGPMTGNYPGGGMMGMGEAMCEKEGPEKRFDPKRKEELFKLATGIAAQVAATTKRRERCLLRQMVEMLLDN